jgi:hypothetical protein
MQEPHPIGSQEAQTPPETQVDQTHRLIDGRVFRGNIAVVRHRFHRLEFSEDGTLFGVEFPKCEHGFVRLKETMAWTAVRSNDLAEDRAKNPS